MLVSSHQPLEIIKIGGKTVNNVSPHQRNCGMVFQSYALFPHMNVFDNVAYSLNIKQLRNNNMFKKLGTYTRMLNSKIIKYPKHIEEKVLNILEYVELKDHAKKLIGELSGGQQQRVALARALIMEPEVLLMDEPLSNLDQKLRHTMRNTIRKIQQELKITTIFVTHDQEEAMSMADRVAVMKDGEILQTGTPTELYSHPKSTFIADFVGTSNILPGKVTRKENNFTYVQVGSYEIKSSLNVNQEDVQVVIRPENIIVKDSGDSSDDNYFEGVVELATYLGSTVRYDIKVGQHNLLVDTVYESGEKIFKSGAKIKLIVHPERVLLI
ncbi:ABC transporter ATP-binding protein [Lentibacillus sp. L22]|uniref:ABC transporter ATP-binding protein n=1 Tax=Lentibacillus sp. L22 TaxID=3163028 RepID=UPI0034654BE2